MNEKGPSPKERRNELTRERIRAAAVQLFREKGYDQTSTADIADAAAISHRTLFRYFRAKEDIIFGRPESLIPRAQAVIAALDAGLSDWEIVQTALCTFGAFMQSNEAEVRPPVELIHTVPELYPRRTLMQERWAHAVATALARRRGQQEPTFDDLAVASAGLGIYAIAVRRWLEDGGRSLPQLIEETFDRFEGGRGSSRPPRDP